MKISPRVILVALVGALVAVSGGCGSKSGNGQAFLDQKKTVGPGQDWSREVTSKNGGTISFRITSSGPCEVYLLTSDGYQAVKSKNAAGMRAGLLFSKVSTGPTVEGQATVPAGSSWFVIGNKGGSSVEFRLECFEGTTVPGAPPAPVAPVPSPQPRTEVPAARPTERPRMAQPTEVSKPRPPEPPAQDAPAIKMTEGAKLDPYTDAVIHTDNTALIASPGGKLKHVRLSDGKAEKTYSLAVDPYRMVLDSEKGVLYAACTDKLVDPKDVKRDRDALRGLYGRGHLYTFDVKDILAGKADDGTKLTHTTKVTIGPVVTTLLLSPDGEWVYLLHLEPRDIKRVNTKTGKVDSVVDDLLPEMETMCLTPDGKSIFAASHVGPFDHYTNGPFVGVLHQIDTAKFRLVRKSPLKVHAQDIRATDGGLLFLSAGSGQHVGVTAVDINDIDTPTGLVEKHNWCVSPGSDMLCLSPDQKLLFVSHGWWGTAHIHAVGVPAKLNGNAKDVSVNPGDDATARRELRISRDGKFLLCDNGRVIVVEPK